MLNPESVDCNIKGIADILFTDGEGDEVLKITLKVTDARRLAKMILERTAWRRNK